jgi:hypothetical protein
MRARLVRGWSRHAGGLAVVAALLVLLGCASDQASIAPGDSISAERVVAAGYNVIVNRYVDPVEDKTLALYTLRGLRSLDTQLTVDETPDAKLVIADGGKPLGVWQEPGADDARG